MQKTLTRQNFLKQQEDSPTQGVNILDLALENEHGQVKGVSVKEYFWNNVHNYINCKIVMNMDKSGLRGK